jgi:Na+-driven multidrug efflux pump
MDGILILLAMVVCALVTFGVLVSLVRGGQSGWSMTILSLLGACFAVLLYASGRPFGIDPVFAMSTALLFVLPALAGGGAGALLGWLLRKRDDRKRG